jgi:hypothetical protein
MVVENAYTVLLGKVLEHMLSFNGLYLSLE